MKEKVKWIGIDYGSKLAGTTAICHEDKGKLNFTQSEKKQDADAFISSFVDEYEPIYIFIDAPLSLPAAYFGKGNDFFYRKCDRELKAMSPMFLGGLTARAMSLKSSHPKQTFLESYPGYLIKETCGYGKFYQKRKTYETYIHNKLKKQLDLNFKSAPKNWHQLDALACWVIGWRHFNGEGQVIGDENEGRIYL